LYAFLLIYFISCRSSDHENLNQSFHVLDGFEVVIAAGSNLLEYPMFATLDNQGRLFVFESIGNVYEKSEDALKDPKFRIKLLEDEDGDGLYDKSTIYADNVGF